MEKEVICGEHWDAGKSLYEMLDIDLESESASLIKPYLPDYKIHLIQPEQIKNMQVFRTCLQHIFNMVKLKKEKEKLNAYLQIHREELQNLDYVETLAAFMLLGESKRIENLILENKKGEDIKMCKAIEDMIKDGEQRGIECGIERGEEKVLSLINILIRNNCEHLIPQIVQDTLFREQMYREYHL